MLAIKTSNAELSSQVTTRKNDFLKPVDRYKIINIFGRSIVTVEGQDWRRHRKVVGPSFSEKSNKLVFEESLRQAMGMMEYWAKQDADTDRDIRVRNTAVDAAVLSLHVICAAGFGLPQLWPGERKEKLEDRQFPGLSTLDLSGEHSMTFKQSMHQLLQGIRWLVAFPPWLLSMQFLSNTQ
jgi:cytochrome P450